MKRFAVLCFLILTFGFASSVSAADIQPMLKKYTNRWDYGENDDRLEGYVPVLGSRVIRPWELVRGLEFLIFPRELQKKLRIMMCLM